MPDSASRRIPWPRIFAEGVVIIASILLALAADAWWDERSDQRELEAALVNVSAEISTGRQELLGAVDDNQTRNQDA
jgi:hypothetical protein